MFRGYNFGLKNISKRSICISNSNFAKVTLIEPDHPLGHNLSLLLKQSKHISELKLYSENKLNGLVADLSHINTNTQITQLHTARDSFRAIYGSDIVILAAPNLLCSKYPTPAALLEANMEYLKNSIKLITNTELSPLIVFAVEPINSSIYYIKKILQRHYKYDPKKLLGVFSHKSTMMNTAVASLLGLKPENLNCFPSIGTLNENIFPLIGEFGGVMNSQLVNDNSKINASIIKYLNKADADVISSKSSPFGLFMTHAYSIGSYVNSVCQAIDNNTLTTLATVVDQHDLDEYIGEKYFTSHPLVINENGILGKNDNFSMCHKKLDPTIHSMTRRQVELALEMISPEPSK